MRVNASLRAAIREHFCVRAVILLKRNQANVLFFDRKPAQEKPWTQKLWIYDLRTNLHFTLKENTLKRTDLDDFVACYFGQVSLSAPGGEGRGEVARTTPLDPRRSTLDARSRH